MIREFGKLYILDTESTTNAFRILPTGQPEHLWYGKKIRLEKESDADALTEQHAFVPGNTNPYNKEHTELSLEDACLEMSAFGKGDIREPLIELIHADGSRTCDFVFEKAVISDHKTDAETLPTSYGDAEELKLCLKDTASDIRLELYYDVYEKEDIITRRSKLINGSENTITLDRLMSLQLDLSDEGYVVSSFTGSWAREMNRTDAEMHAGKLVLSSMTGSSSNRVNPFFMLSRKYTSENSGPCYGFNLVYSGNHSETVEVSGYGKTRIVSGINPSGFMWQLKPGEAFEAPEAVMTFSNEGFNGMSLHMHRFVRECIVRGSWKKELRPVLINSWESFYFNFNEEKLLKLARTAKSAGIELFVLDDGWFGKRDSDTCSLGDWDPNPKKLPGGLKSLGDKLKTLGMKFGIWVEPEMISVDSDLYRSHPDWSIDIPGRDHTEGRSQRILDLTNSVVQDYLIDKMSAVFSSADISYVKWDMNRTFTDVYSRSLPPEQQGEVFHRYITGLYRVMKTLTERFPKILFEGCAAGGNRFDLGILCYFPQIWASDNTDAVCRAQIQTGYSYGYPPSVIGAHVSNCPNHQTLRTTPLFTRFAAASFGLLGYEFNLSELPHEELNAVKEQIAFYKKHRRTLQFGTFYRGRSGAGRNGIFEWTCVSDDRQQALGMILQTLVQPNTEAETYTPSGLDPDIRYHFSGISRKYNVMEFGDLINTASPVHIRQNSLAHKAVSKFIKMPGETEDLSAFGSVLMAGIRLKQAFAGTGYDERVRHFPDFASRIYIMEAESAKTTDRIAEIAVKTVSESSGE